MIRWENEKDTLSQLIINEKLSYEEIGRRYGWNEINPYTQNIYKS